MLRRRGAELPKVRFTCRRKLAISISVSNENDDVVFGARKDRRATALGLNNRMDTRFERRRDPL